MHELMKEYLITESRKISYFYGSNTDREQFRVLLARRRTYSLCYMLSCGVTV